jgi:hypothetical protein
MGPNPKPSFSFSLYNTINNLDLHPRLKLLLSYSLYNRRPPKDIFDNVSYYYYMSYVRPKLTMVLKGKDIVIRGRRYSIERYIVKPYLTIFVSPSYMLYYFDFKWIECYRYSNSCDTRDNYGYYFDFKWIECYRYSNSCDTRDNYGYYYVFGVDNDGVFVNRVTGAPDIHENSIKINDNIELRFISDNAIRGVMGYSIDLGDLEEVTIDVDPEKMGVIAANIRIQGDIVLRLEPLNESRLLLGYIGYNDIISHVRLLLIDIINRILLDYGLSPTIRVNAIVLESAVPRRNDRTYRLKVFRLLAKELKELLGDNISVNENIEEIRITGGDFRGFTIRVDIGGGGYANPYNHIIISIARNSLELENNELIKRLFKELLEALESTPFTNIEFSIGNHYIRIINTKPLSLMFRPSRQPLTLNENIITIMNPLTFIVTPDTIIELSHREHGLKVVRFKNNYILTFSDINTHRDYLSSRNRVIIRNLEL